MSVVTYQGTADAVCPITLEPLDSLTHPVAFVCTPQQPFECQPLIDWLIVHRTNPVTRQKIVWNRSPLEAVAPLADICPDSDLVCSYIERTLGDFIENPLEIGNMCLAFNTGGLTGWWGRYQKG